MDIRFIRKEIFEHLDKLLYECIPFIQVDYPFIIDFMYSDNLIRLKKMNELYGKKSDYYVDDTCVCLFQMDLKTKIFYINYNEIWKHLENKYNLKHRKIQQITTSWIKRLDDYFKLYTTYVKYINSSYNTGEFIDINEYITSDGTLIDYKLKEFNKLKTIFKKL